MAQQKHKTLAFAIVGAGNAVGPYHAQAVQAVAGTELVALVDTNREALVEVGQRFPQARLFATQADMHRSGIPVDVEILALPTRLHTEALLAAVAAGHNVMGEKPFTARAEDVATVFDAARQRRVRVHGIGQRRFMIDEIAPLLRPGGPVGEVLTVDLVWLRAGEAPPFAARDPRGAFADLGVHQLKTLMALMPSRRPLAISGTAFRDGEQGEYLASARIHFEGGLVANIRVGWSLHPSGGGATPPLEDEVTLTLVGRNATVTSSFPTWETEVAELARHRPTVTRWRNGRMEATRLGVVPSVDACRVREVQEMVDWVNGGPAPSYRLSERRVVGVIDGYYESAHNDGALVRLSA